ncbi:MAG: hypothetical protein U1A72_16710 [Sulfuritalea sp.]|nr:hypothetical protein [Sulfuritalea sp.]
MLAETGDAAMPMRLLFVGALVVALSGCVSQFATGYVGKTALDLELELGQPTNVVALPEGRRAYQYYWGGGTFIAPQTTTGSVNVVGNTALVTSTTTPSIAVTSEGCLVNFIAEQRGEEWLIVDARWPARLSC